MVKLLASTLAAAEPDAAPRTRADAPNAPVAPAMTVPLRACTPPVHVLAPLKISGEKPFELFSITLVTLPVPMTPMMVVEPVPVPELVIVPVLLGMPVMEMRPAALALNTRFPVPLDVPTVRVADGSVEVIVVPPLLTMMLPVTESGELLLA